LCPKCGDLRVAIPGWMESGRYFVVVDIPRGRPFHVFPLAEVV
jgi:hypothetical protein